MIELRAGRTGDEELVHAVHAAAFDTDLEERLCGQLCADVDILLSPIAFDGPEAVGNVILSSMVAKADGDPFNAAAIVPVGVLSDRQCEGIGSQFMRAATDWSGKR